jgi:hypothetical protein
MSLSRALGLQGLGFTHLRDVTTLNVAGNHVTLREKDILEGEALLGVLEPPGPHNRVA